MHRAVITKIDQDNTLMQTAEIVGFADEVSNKVDRFQNYGFSSYPKAMDPETGYGAEVVLAPLNDSDSLKTIIATDDRRYRPTFSNEGEVALYTFNDDQNITLKIDGDDFSIVSRCGGTTITQTSGGDIISDNGTTAISQFADGLITSSNGITTISQQPDGDIVSSNNSSTIEQRSDGSIISDNGVSNISQSPSGNVLMNCGALLVEGQISASGVIASGGKLVGVTDVSWDAIIDPFNTKPDDNATRGAPSGTLVSGMDADLLASAAVAGEAASVDMQNLLDNMVSDGVLSMSEKLTLRTTWAEIQATQIKHGLTYIAFPTELAALTAAYDEIETRVVPYINIDGDSLLDTPALLAGATAATELIVDWYDSQTILLEVVSAAAATSAVWTSVSGTGKPADNATEGAPSGTMVGGVDADALVAQAQQASVDVADWLVALASDGILSMTEKLDLRKGWAAITIQHDKFLLAYSADYSTYTNALVAAYDEIATRVMPYVYIDGDSILTVPNQITAVAEGSQLITDWYDRRADLLKAVSDDAANTATWLNIVGTGKPADNANVTDLEGGLNLSSVLFNPDCKLVALDGRPAGLRAAYSSTDPSIISYLDAEKSIAKIYSDTDNTVGVCWPAFRVTQGATYTVFARVKSSAVAANGFYFRLNETDDELATGVTFVNGQATLNEEPGAPWYRHVSIRTNAGITDEWDEFSYTYTPSATAKYTSPMFLNWDGMGTSELHIDICLVTSNATYGSTWSSNISGQPTDTQLLNSNTTPADIGYTGALDADKTDYNNISISNAAITVGSNGVLNGAGGGQVTLTGIGYSGATNATYGATTGQVNDINDAATTGTWAGLTGTVTAANIAAVQGMFGSISALNANLGTVNAGSITGSAGIDITGTSIFKGSTYSGSYGFNATLTAHSANNTSGSGILAISGTSSGHGIYADGVTTGVYGSSYSGTGVSGKSTTGYALYANGKTYLGGQILTNSTTKVTNLNADRLDNYHAGNSSGQIPVSNGSTCTNLHAQYIAGHRAGRSGSSAFVPTCSSGSGVMEIGRYLDFHDDTGTADYDSRIYCTGNKIYLSGDLNWAGTATGTYSSDIRLKDHIEPITKALESVNALNGVTFRWKDSGKPAAGVIAQEVQKVLPDFVEETSTGNLGVDYLGLTGVLIEAVKELSAQVDQLTKEINNLKKDK